MSWYKTQWGGDAEGWAPPLTGGLWDFSQLGSSVFLAGYRMMDTNGANAGAEYNSSTGTWSDWSGNGRHATQATSGNRPTYGATALDGTRPGLTFDGNDFFTAPLTLAAAGGRPAIFAVVKPTTGLKSATGVVFWRGTGAAATGLSFFQAERLGYTWNDDSSTWSYSAGSPLITLGTVYTWGLHAPDQTAAIVITDGTEHTNTSNVHVTMTNNTVDVTIGKDPEGSGNRELIGVLAEAAIVDGAVLTAANRDRAMASLMWKHGLQGNLPGGHTYASAPPTV